jgi:hypothetical protein
MHLFCKGEKNDIYHFRSVLDHSAMTDTINMSVAKPLCNAAATGIRNVNEYRGSARREIEKKKMSPLGKLKQKGMHIITYNRLFIYRAQMCFRIKKKYCINLIA